MPTTSQTPLDVAEVRRALLLVGSPKTRKSTSHALGSYLYEQLEARAIATETIYLHTVLSNPRKMQALLDAVAVADLVTLAFPLYVDALPAPVVEALERIVAARQGKSMSRRQMFAAIANCGFPEAHQCATALAICRRFARQAEFTWAGSLALGGGEMIGGIALVEGGGKTLLVRQALAQTAAALAQGHAVPEAARAVLAKPIIPHRLYWLLAGMGWLRSARQYGVLRLLRRQPYLANSRSRAD